MSAAEETKEISVSPSVAPVADAASRPATPSFLTRAMELLSSVRFGVIMLVLLIIAAMIGMKSCSRKLTASRITMRN